MQFANCYILPDLFNLASLPWGHGHGSQGLATILSPQEISYLCCIGIANHYPGLLLCKQIIIGCTSGRDIASMLQTVNSVQCNLTWWKYGSRHVRPCLCCNEWRAFSTCGPSSNVPHPGWFDMGRKINPVQLPQHPGKHRKDEHGGNTIDCKMCNRAIMPCWDLLKTTKIYKTTRQTWHNDVRLNLLPGDQQIPVGVQQFGRKFHGIRLCWNMCWLLQIRLDTLWPATCFLGSSDQTSLWHPCSSFETRFSVKSWHKSISNHPKKPS